MVTAGRIAARRSVASTNSDIMPKIRQDSRADADCNRASDSTPITSFSLSVTSYASLVVGGRFVLPLSCFPRPARPAQQGRRTDGGHLWRPEHATPAGKRLQGGLQGRRLRRQGQDLPRRLVSGIQSPPAANAG